MLLVPKLIYPLSLQCVLPSAIHAHPEGSRRFKWDVWDSSLTHHDLPGRNNLSLLVAGCPIFDSSGYYLPISWWQLKLLEIHIMWAPSLAHWAERAVPESTHFIFDISSAKNRAGRILHPGGAFKELLLLARGLGTTRSCPCRVSQIQKYFSFSG